MADRGALSEVDSMSPQNEAVCTLPFLIGSPSQLSGMSAFVRLIVAARSSVRLRQLASSEQNFE